jgi:hypothetical protein
MKSKIIFIVIATLLYAKSFSQVNNTESFDGTTFVPTGWTNLLVSGTNTWTRVTAGTFPTQSPRSGLGEARFNSYNVNGGVRALVSPVIDYTNRSGASTTISFWMYRDNGYNTTPDKIDVYMNTAPNLTGASLLGTVNRARGLSPVVVANGWYQYSFTVPLGFTTATNYFIIRATSAFGNNIFIDDVSWTSFPPPFIDITPTSIINPSGNFNCFSNNQTVSIQVKNNGSVPINFLSNPVTINCSVTIVPSNTAIASSTVVISPFILNSGILAAGSTTVVNITNTLNMLTSGSYSFNISTSVIGDINALNNALPVSSVLVSKVNSYPYEVDFSSLPNPNFLVQQVSGTGNWSNVLTGNLTFPTLAPVLNSGSGFAFFDSYSYSSGTVSNLILPSFDFSSIANPVFELWVSQDNGYTTSNDRLDILVSTNGGATWSASLLTIPRYNAAFTTPGWKLFSIPLTIYAGVSCCRIAIRATSAFGNNMAIDYLKVYNTGSILPIKLIDFSGEIYSDNQNILFWQTAEEVNTEKFRIDRSYDGINFEPVHFEIAKGEQVGANYHFIDDVDDVASIIYYRLVSIDYDNSSEIFKVISIDRNISKEFSLKLYPNPSYNNTKLQINSDDVSEVLIEIFDLVGNQISSEAILLLEGKNDINLNTTNLSEGVYFIKLFSLSADSYKSNQKFIKLQ